MNYDYELERYHHPENFENLDELEDYELDEKENYE
jgi:hypothetical protein